MAWIIATKLEMTRVIKNDRFIPITLLQVPTLKVVWFKTLEKDGYKAIMIGVLNDKVEDAQLEKWKVTLNKSNFSKIVEFPVSDEENEKYNVGDTVSLDVLEGDVKVSVEWFSKWKYNFFS